MCFTTCLVYMDLSNIRKTNELLRLLSLHYQAMEVLLHAGLHINQLSGLDTFLVAKTNQNIHAKINKKYYTGHKNLIYGVQNLCLS